MRPIVKSQLRDKTGDKCRLTLSSHLFAVPDKSPAVIGRMRYHYQKMAVVLKVLSAFAYYTVHSHIQKYDILVNEKDKGNIAFNQML